MHCGAHRRIELNRLSQKGGKLGCALLAYRIEPKKRGFLLQE
jgi:hypothetical protein